MSSNQPEDDSQERSSANYQGRTLMEKLNYNSFILAAGTLQDFLKSRQEKPKPIGFPRLGVPQRTDITDNGCFEHGRRLIVCR
jgi:Tfp pilus assembly protein PilV